MVAARGREEQVRVPMRQPIAAEDRQRALWEGHIAVLRLLTAMDMDNHPSDVDVTDLKIQGLLKPEPERVDGPKEGLVVRSADGVNYSVDLIDAQDIGK